MNSKLLPNKRAFLITGLLIIIICCNTCPIILGSLTSNMVKEGSKIVVDWTEDDMYRYSTYTVMYWNGFLQSKLNEDYWLNSYEEIQDIDLHLEFDFDKMLVKGYFSGSSESTIPGRYESKQVFNGDITGTIKRTNWGNKWYWEWEGTATTTLQYILKQPYSDESGSHMNTRDETIQVTADFEGGNLMNDATTFNLLWKDEGGHEQAERKFSFSFDEDEGLVPPEWPDPIDINIDVSGPEYISVGQDEATFELEVSGSEVSSVQQVVWHFWFGEADYYYHINSVVNSEPVSLTVSDIMEEWTLEFESSSVTVDGIEQLPMMVEVILFSDTDQSEQLVAPVEYEFDYVDANIDPITGGLIPPETTGTGETSSEETSTGSSTDAPPPSTGSNPLMTPVGLTATGGALAITGYGISRALKGRSFDLKKGSELERELSDIELTSETDQLVLDDAKLSGSIDTGKIDVSPGGADPIDLEKGSLVQSNGAVISDGFSVSEELAQAESSLRIEGDGAPTDTPVDGEISVKATELDDQVKMNIGLNLENGEFSASSNAEIDSSIRDDKTQAPGPKIEHELSDIELTSETDKLAIDNSELSGTIDTGKIDVSQGKVDTLELEKGTLVQPDPSKLDTLDGPSMSEESVHTESTLRIEGDGTQTDIPLDGEISIKATENEGQVKMNVGLDLENDEFSVSSKKKVDSSGQDEKTNKRDN